MRYDNPQLRERLAAEYVLGTMPRLTRRRFERVIARDASLAAAVAVWAERLLPLDDATPEEAPPARVWRAIDRLTTSAPPVTAPPSVSPARPPVGALAFWRALAATALAACAALVLYVVAMPPPPPPRVVAVLADKAGTPGWIATAGPRRGDVRVSALGGVAADPAHSFELWGIAGGKPRPLGLLQPEPGRPLLLSAAALPGHGGVLAISEEPPRGSPTGLPTGPVLYQGKVLAGAL